MSRLVTSVILLLMAARPLAAFGGQLALTWVDTATDELGFSVERSEGTAGAFAVLATTGQDVTTYTDATVVDAATYCYRVRAFNSLGFSEYSDAACGTAAPAALTLALHVNQQVFAVGDRCQVDVSIANGAPPMMVDVYLGSALPPALAPGLGCSSGDPVAYVVDAPAELDGLVVRCLTGPRSGAVPLYEGVSFAGAALPVTFGFTWPRATGGDYTFFAAVTEAGTMNVVALGTVTVRYAP